MEGGARRIVILIVLVAVAGLGVLWYWQRSKQRALGSGNVYVRNQGADNTQPASTPSAATTTPSPSAESAPTETSSAPSPAQSATKPSAAVQNATRPSQSAHVQPLPMTQPRGALEVPAADTIPRNPPNGLIFAGAGKYQLYRQGDITWRLDTDNGRACIIFATDTMWSRTRVYDAGCGTS